MKIISSHTDKVPDKYASGDIYITIVINGEEQPGVRIGKVQFAPDSKLAWHSHSGGEYLYILEGTALVQERGGEVKELRAGDTVFTEPGVEHWHGSPSDSTMTHLAIWGAASQKDGEEETKWGDHVPDKDLS